MIYTYLATAILSAGLAFYSGWTVNQWRFDSAQKQAIAQAAADQRELHRLEQARSRAALDTQVAARKQEARLRSDAAASQSALVGLQHDTDEALRTAAGSLAACTAVSATLGELFVTSSGRYRSVAQEADACGIELRAQLETP